jgi:response regulator RpfG family c-di-GMP phosphodiesterase
VLIASFLCESTFLALFPLIVQSRSVFQPLNRVLIAANCTQATHVESSFLGTIHLLLSDVMMADMSGPVIAQVLKKHRPEMRVMLMSGCPDGEILFLTHGWYFIEKPFLATELVRRVNELLHTPEGSQADDHFDIRIKPEAAAA